VRLPDNLDFAAGSTVLHVYLTAWYALVERAQLRPGEIVLVTGAAGGVGLGCVELAHAMGARVIAAVGSPEKADIVRRYGADHVINYASEDIRERIKSFTEGEGVDVCVEMSAASSLRRSPGSCDGTGGSCRSVLPAAKSRPF